MIATNYKLFNVKLLVKYKKAFLVFKEGYHFNYLAVLKINGSLSNL